MPSGLKHQSFPDPVELFHKMETSFKHILPLENRGTAGNYPNRISTGVGINTKESF
jgi:hypothetical protein